MNRPWPSILVLATAAVAAAAVQEAFPPAGVLRLKPPLFAAITIYYAMRREKALAAVAAAVCGFFEDSLSGVPAATSLLVFAAAVWFLAVRVRPQMRECALSCAAMGFALAPALSLTQYVALRLGGSVPALPAWFVAGRVAAAAPLGFVAALATAKALGALDWISANVDDGGEDGDDDFAG